MMTDIRQGAPLPLIHHLVSAAALYETGARLAPAANQRRFPWADPPDSGMKAVAAATAEADRMSMALSLRAEYAHRLSEMARGIRMYQSHPERRDEPEAPVIWSRGAARLLDYGPPTAPPVFVIPSLINRYYILDLEPGGSMIGSLRAAGFRPLVLDWGAPAAEEQSFSLTDYTERRLAPAFEAARAAVDGKPVSVVGYCMGGTMAVALAQQYRDAVANLVLLGAPWDFSKMTPMRAALAAVGLRGRGADLDQALRAVAGAFGAIPVHMLQLIFALLDPGLAARKFRHFVSLDQTGSAARRFVLIEDWLNDGPAFSGPAAREALIDWHMDNRPLSGTWRVFGTPVRTDYITCPTMVVAARSDRIAPPAATTPLASRIENARLVQPDTGHVGMIVGRSAPAQVWHPMVQFMRNT